MWYVCISKSKRILCASFFWIAHILFVHMVKFLFLAQFRVNHLSHLLVSNLILFFAVICSVLSIIALKSLVPMALFCAVIRKESVSVKNFPFLAISKIFRERFFVYRLKYPYSCFPSLFYFLVIFVLLMLVLSVSFLVAIIRFPTRLLMWSSSRCNNNGDSVSPWNIPLWIFTSAKLFTPAVSSILHFSMVISINFMTLPDILYILRQSFIQFCGTKLYSLL